MPYWFWGQKVKGQGHGAWLFENGFRTITDSVINQWSWNFIHLLTMSQGCALLILRSKGQRSRSWRMVIWKCFRTITDSVINLWSWNFIHLLTMSQGCALLILRSKGQRSRSWRMVIWKWFPDDNWLCNQPMIMKLHTLTPHEFVGVGGGPVLLQQYFQYAFICCPYMLPLLFLLQCKWTCICNSKAIQLMPANLSNTNISPLL